MSNVLRAALSIVQTSDDCVCYRLLVGTTIVWRTRTFRAIPEGHGGARNRMARWALKHGYQVVERQAAEVVRTEVTHG